MSLVFAACVIIVVYYALNPEVKVPFFDYGKKQVTPSSSDVDEDEDSWIPVEPKKKSRAAKKQE